MQIYQYIGLTALNKWFSSLPDIFIIIKKKPLTNFSIKTSLLIQFNI